MEEFPLTEEQEVELAALQPREAHRKQQMKAKSARHRRVRRAEADRVAELEELAGRAPLTEEQEAELAALQPKVVQRKQQNTERAAKDYQTRKAAADRVAELGELVGGGGGAGGGTGGAPAEGGAAETANEEKEREVLPDEKSCRRSGCGVGGVGVAD
ncbi:hypothetical protein [Saccharopolyspora spinosa]|uniref:hypothetical protein n=1 Tax=Saccharopolyspora spinosa TaxID=60894 RepID=UPI00178C1C24|nr:hypothetical protein [Saccharopolyspora spinosa]